MFSMDASLANFLLCLRPETEQAVLNQWSLESWHAILEQAARFQLVPLLFQRLVRERPGAWLPPQVEHELRNGYYRTLALNAQNYATIAPALTALHQEQIGVLLLKGVYLAEFVYQDIGLRPMGDLDLLVPRADLQRALTILGQAGFESEREYLEQADGQLHFHAPALEKNGTMVEIHWDLASPNSPIRPDIPALWQRSGPLKINNSSAFALDPGDQLLYLCVHASYTHIFYHQLRSLCDVREVLAVQGEQIDWGAFVLSTERWNARKGVYLALQLTRELLGAIIPDAVLEALKPDENDPQTLTWAHVQLFRTTPTLSVNFNRLMRKGTPGERLTALWTALFPSPEVMSRIFGIDPNSSRLPWLYFINAVTRFTSYWRHALALLVHNDQRTQEADSSLNLQDWLENEN